MVSVDTIRWNQTHSKPLRIHISTLVVSYIPWVETFPDGTHFLLNNEILPLVSLYIFEIWDASQNGLSLELPQRHSIMRF